MNKLRIVCLFLFVMFFSACARSEQVDDKAATENPFVTGVVNGKKNASKTDEQAKEIFATEERLEEYRKLLDPKMPVTIRVWHYYNGVQKHEFDRLTTEFNERIGKKLGIIVEASSKGGTSDLVAELLRSANWEVGAHELPNLSMSYADVAWELDQKGILANFNRYFTEEELEEFVAVYLEEGKLHRMGQLKILPIAKSTELMILNKTDWTVFAEETGSEISELSTMEGLVQVAKRYYDWSDRKTKTPNDGRAFFGRDAVANYVFTGMRELSGDLIYYDEQGKIRTNTDKASIRKLYDHFYMPYVFGYFNAESRFRSDDMRMGNILCFIGSSTASSYLKNDVINEEGKSRTIEYEVLPIPHFEAAIQKTATQQGAGMILLKSESRLEYASTVFLRWLTSKENNAKFAINTGYLPVKDSLYREGVFQEELQAQKVKTSFLQDQSYRVGMETVRDCDLLVPVAFDQSFRFRQEIQRMMETGAHTARERYLDLVSEQGVAQAKAMMKDEGLFEEWYEEFVRMVEGYRMDVEATGKKSEEQ